MTEHINLYTKVVKCYKLSQNVKIPIQATSGSACFDVHAFIEKDSKVKAYGKNNVANYLDVHEDSSGTYILINPNERVLIPTGIIFDILEGHSLRLHPRSSLSLKKGLTLINACGIIDSDYVEETFIPIHNTSGCKEKIYSGERISQVEIVPHENCIFTQTLDKPIQKTNRNGGFGSTGIS